MQIDTLILSGFVTATLALAISVLGQIFLGNIFAVLSIIIAVYATIRLTRRWSDSRKD